MTIPSSSFSQRRYELSVVVPIFNEYESIPLLVEKITTVAQSMDVPYELLCVDDGSMDGSAELLKDIARERHDLRVILLRRNYGQTPAMAAGCSPGSSRTPRPNRL